MAISKSDLKFYMTSVTPEVEQTIYSQSIGGYAATVPSDATASLVYPDTTLSSDVDLYGTALTLGSVSDMAGFQYLNINFEVIKVDAISTTSVTANQRGLNSIRNTHESTTDVVRGMFANSVFNDTFNDDLKQYRCIALKNNSSTETAFGLNLYFRQNSRNSSTKVRMAVEAPLSDYITGTATDGTQTQVTASSFIAAHDDNHFEDALLRITSGANINQSRVVLSFDSATGTFVLDSALPSTVLAGVTFEVEPTPAQRLSSGVIRPAVGSGLVSDFSLATRSEAIGINVGESRDSGEDLLPNDVIYIWLERELGEDGEEFDANTAVITASYFSLD